VRALRGVRRLLARVISPRVRELPPVAAVIAAASAMGAADVAEVVALLAAQDVSVWVSGGWGVDALVGRRTRRHDDLDLLVDRDDTPRAITALRATGYRQVGANVVEHALLPERVLLHHPRGYAIDLHPVDVDEWLRDTVAPQLPGEADPAAAAFATGHLDDRAVPCLSRALQLAAHRGYEAREVDRRDVALLQDAAPG
jgi:lincosamide nucleotidyltransferase A/C/D/E